MRDQGIVITITNSKDGVGKTTTTLNLGAALAAKQKRVLLIDNDVQGNLTAALGYTPSEQKYSLGKLLLSAIDTPEDIDLHLPRAILHTESGLDMIAANGRLSDAAARMQVMQMSQYGGGESGRPCETVMEEIITPLRTQYDYIIHVGNKRARLIAQSLKAINRVVIVASISIF